jgi:hypothetical protein
LGELCKSWGRSRQAAIARVGPGNASARDAGALRELLHVMATMKHGVGYK